MRPGNSRGKHFEAQHFKEPPLGVIVAAAVERNGHADGWHVFLGLVEIVEATDSNR